MQRTEERPIESYFADYNKTQVKLLEDNFGLIKETSIRQMYEDRVEMSNQLIFPEG